MEREWTISQLHAKLKEELRAPGLTSLESCMIKTISGKEIRLKAEALREQGKLTATEARIALEYGYK